MFPFKEHDYRIGVDFFPSRLKIVCINAPRQNPTNQPINRVFRESLVVSASGRRRKQPTPTEDRAFPTTKSALADDTIPESKCTDHLNNPR
jgi:hypothetical protein